MAAEAAWLREAGARLVLGDIPPLAFAAAAVAGAAVRGPRATSRGTGSTPTSAAREPGLVEAAARAREAYARAELLLRLPFAGDLSAFRRVEDVPLVARKPAVAKAEARRAAAVSTRRPAVLLSFGGLGLPGSPAGRLRQR